MEYYWSIIAFDMNKNKPVALSCERCWTDPFTSVVGFSSSNDKKGKKVKIDSDKNVMIVEASFIVMNIAENKH